MNQPGATEPSYEAGRDNTLEYPQEYFEVQVKFAARWAELSGEDLSESLMHRTALARRLGFGMASHQQNFDELVAGTESVDSLSNAVFDAYTSSPYSVYSPLTAEGTKIAGRQFFANNYYPNNQLNGGRNTIKVHFINGPRNEKSSLASEFMTERKARLKSMIEGVYQQHPEANEVAGGSWLYNVPAYRDSFPPEFTRDMPRLVPRELADQLPDGIPNMAFTGNSVWGQFVNHHGWANQERCDQFIAGVDAATSLVDLYEALPLKPLQPTAEPEAFLNWDPAA